MSRIIQFEYQSVHIPSIKMDQFVVHCLHDFITYIHLNLRNRFHDFMIYPFIHFIVIHKNKKDAICSFHLHS